MIKKVIHQQVDQWMDKRLASESDILLTQQRLFILPSMQGVFFLLIQILLLLIAINYQNNLVYALCFFLFSLFISAIFFTFFNLNGLRLVLEESSSPFAGQTAFVRFAIEKQPKAQHHHILCHFKGESQVVFDLLESNQHRIALPMTTDKRGWLSLPELTIKSTFPLGLVTCWSRLRFKQNLLIYPTPLDMDQRQLKTSGRDDEGEGQQMGDEHFKGFKAFEEGEALSRIYWKGVAKGQPMLSKEYSDGQSKEAWIDWDALPYEPFERRISQLTGLANYYHQSGQVYGCRLPGITLPPSNTDAHYHKILTALALL
ncbi:MAG: DUF58 domain-containing protein [Cellvibrionales bacterium]|nr:DUF58 domain-containing protein [Cellvibrionales bacterium]